MFELVSDYAPAGDQPQAIEKLTTAILSGAKHQTLLGVTGSGKTFTIANVIKNIEKPTLVISHNKTLAAQLYAEFKGFFPNNAVEYFVSYFDYYQPEAYIPRTDTFIEKDSSVNDEIERLRLSTMSSLFSRKDVIVVASVSCIYGIGSKEDYEAMVILVRAGMEMTRDHFLRRLVDLQYNRNDIEFTRGQFRVRGDTIELCPAGREDALRVEFFGDQIDRITRFEPLTGEPTESLPAVMIYPAKQFVTPAEKLRPALLAIRQELGERIAWFEKQGKLLEAQRLKMRTEYDLEMMEEMGFCSGIENYSRHLSGRKTGEPPPTLLDYFPSDFLIVIDESHQTVPQLQAMYRGDRARKETLVDYGFRLPSALDNRPLKFEEFEDHVRQAIYVSATPGDYELERAQGVIIEQLIRPTGLTDPEVEVRPVSGQVDDLLGEIKIRVKKNERVLVTTLTKRMAEDLTDYYRELAVRVRYLHSDIDTLERIDILRDLRLGEFDVLVGINLLREGLDLPEVSLVAIFDADKEGFLRSPRSLIQTIGRAARNVNGRVIMYAEAVTSAMKFAIEETDRRRAVQTEYNEQRGIVPTTVVRAVMNINPASGTIDYFNVPKIPKDGRAAAADAGADVQERLAAMRLEMFAAAENLDFEKAARLRDDLKKMEGLAGVDSSRSDAPQSAFDPYASGSKRASSVRPRGTAKAGASSRGGRRYKAR